MPKTKTEVTSEVVIQSEAYQRRRSQEFHNKWAAVTSRLEAALQGADDKYGDRLRDATLFYSKMDPIVQDFAKSTGDWMEIAYRLAYEACHELHVPKMDRPNIVSDILVREFQQCHHGLMKPIQSYGKDLGVELSDDARWSELQRPLANVAEQWMRRTQDLRQEFPQAMQADSDWQRFFCEIEKADRRFDWINADPRDIMTWLVLQYKVTADLSLKLQDISTRERQLAEQELEKLIERLLVIFREQQSWTQSSDAPQLVGDMRRQIVEIFEDWKAQGHGFFHSPDFISIRLRARHTR